jgi:hypothetical protein
MTLAHDQLLDYMDKEMHRLSSEMYSNSDEAFCHFALQTLYGLDDNDAGEACSFSAAAPGRPDAFWHDEDDGRLVLAETRYRQTAKVRMDRRPLMELTRAWSSLDPCREDPHSAALAETAAAFAQARERDPQLEVELLCVVAGTFTSNALEYAQKFNEEHAADRVRLHLIDLHELADADFERRSREAGPLEQPITLRLRSFFEEESENGGARTLVASIDGLQLAQIEQKHRFRIFQRNVRYQLSGKINVNIDRTLKRADGRRNFWFYNNGISIVCDEYKLDRKRRTVRVENLQIVNGCQTTTTLGANIDHLDDSMPTVLVRIIASKDDELQRDITLYNNRQNAVKDRDLLSNNPIQEGLQQAFEALDPPWFYERKRGAWKAEVTTARDRKRFGSRQINNEKAAQAAYAFYYDPGEARARKRSLFVTRRDDPNGFYDLLFQSSTTPQWLLVPYLVNEFVTARKREYVRPLRALEELPPNQLSVANKKQLQLAWIKVADQAIVGTIAFYLRQRIALSQEDLETLLEDGLLEALLPKAYALAVRDLTQFFMQRSREATDREQIFVPANYLKGNWTEIRDWLATQEEYRENIGEEPFAEFPLLAHEDA